VRTADPQKFFQYLKSDHFGTRIELLRVRPTLDGMRHAAAPVWIPQSG
jgi:hypothetical protein